jgi:hypothetical protein
MDAPSVHGLTCATITSITHIFRFGCLFLGGKICHCNARPHRRSNSQDKIDAEEIRMTVTALEDPLIDIHVIMGNQARDVFAAAQKQLKTRFITELPLAEIRPDTVTRCTIDGREITLLTVSHLGSQCH